jgi:hypothetical protein
MLVLVATTHMQGSVSSDRCFAVDGELVAPAVLDCPDRHCEVCPRAWCGLASGGVTTTAMVVERPGVSPSDLRRAVHEWLDRNGTIDLIVQASEAGQYEVDGVPVVDPVIAVDDLVSAHIREIRDICEHFRPGTIVSRMDSLVSARVMRRAA